MIISDNDTITAISTPIGVGGISIIKVSGNNCLDLLKKIFSLKKNFESHKIYYGFILDDKKILDEVLVSVMIAPKSYTREDVIEINCHGGFICAQKILNLILKNNIRLAEPGEFTKRAYLNGRIDLSQAESVVDLINSKNNIVSDIAASGINGKLSNKINLYSNIILDILTNIEACIDFPDDVFVFDFHKKINRLLKNIEKLIKSYSIGKIINNGINLTIIGKSNVGKSSLMNKLCCEDVSIVTNISGTTRDVIKDNIVINGININIFDTAGIRKSDDLVEKIGIKKTQDCIRKSDLVLCVFDNSREFDNDDNKIIEFCKNKEKIHVLNKKDLENKFDHSKIDFDCLKISSYDDKDIDKIKKKIIDLIFGDKKNFFKHDSIILINARHLVCLEKSYENLKKSLDKNKEYELVSIDLKEAYNNLCEITGKNIDDKLLKNIFEKFCIGK
ncbi:MAG: tRNA uridine-5-carboxymethylaminomethyl(34) synthesis GTPase MnmE [Clostridiales bacterium]|jgi:tRNA modification GTPase|nr:tRNA uridine-5-carboxymethylaminomethyl(34) synthesis GTPase MnmE [Clostridiales bacterium]